MEKFKLNELVDYFYPNDTGESEESYASIKEVSKEIEDFVSSVFNLETKITFTKKYYIGNLLKKLPQKSNNNLFEKILTDTKPFVGRYRWGSAKGLYGLDNDKKNNPQNTDIKEKFTEKRNTLSNVFNDSRRLILGILKNYVHKEESRKDVTQKIHIILQSCNGSAKILKDTSPKH